MVLFVSNYNSTEKEACVCTKIEAQRSCEFEPPSIKTTVITFYDQFI
jgi:hypothetical protein